MIMKWHSSSISFRNIQKEHFLFSLGMQLCVPVSIASECEDKRIYAALCLSLHDSFKYGAVLKFYV